MFAEEEEQNAICRSNVKVGKRAISLNYRVLFLGKKPATVFSSSIPMGRAPPKIVPHQVTFEIKK